MCRCHAEMDEKLEPLNGRLATAFAIRSREAGATMREHLMVQVEKINSRGKKPPLAIPTFCPFCGEKLIAMESA